MPWASMALKEPHLILLHYDEWSKGVLVPFLRGHNSGVSLRKPVSECLQKGIVGLELFIMYI